MASKWRLASFLTASLAVWCALLQPHGAASDALLDGWEPLGPEPKDQPTLALYRVRASVVPIHPLFNPTVEILESLSPNFLTPHPALPSPAAAPALPHPVPLQAWESAYGLQRGSLLPPSLLPLPPDLPPPPHLADCAARTLAQEAAEGGPWRGTGGGGGDGIRWEDTWQQQTGGQEESLSECLKAARTPFNFPHPLFPPSPLTLSPPPPRSSIPPPWASPSPRLSLPPLSPFPFLPAPSHPPPLPFPRLPPPPFLSAQALQLPPPFPPIPVPRLPFPLTPSQVHGTDAANLALTRVAQRDIWAHQMLAADPFHVIASQIHIMADFLGLAMQHNRTLVPLPGSYGPASNSDCRELNQKGEWTCFFFPLAHPACSSLVSHLLANSHMPTCLSLQSQLPQSQMFSQLQQHLSAVQDAVCIDFGPAMAAGAPVQGISPLAAETDPPAAAPASTAAEPAESASPESAAGMPALDTSTSDAAAAAVGAAASLASTIQAAAAAVVSRWGYPHKQRPVMVDRQGALYTMSDGKAQLHWWRSQAARFLLRWPSLHLCHVINRERHVSTGLHVAASLAPAIAAQASLLHSLLSGTVPGTTAATNTTFALRYSKNLPNTTQEAAVLTAAGKASAQAHVLSSRIASSFAAASASASSSSDFSSSSSTPLPTISSLLHSPNSSLLETHVWVGRDGPRRVSVRVEGKLRSEGKGASEGAGEGGGSSPNSMGRLCGATMMANTTVDKLIASIGTGELLTLDPVTIALGGEPYLPRPIAAVHVSRGDEGRIEGAGETAGVTAGETAAVSQALQRLKWLNPNLRRVWLCGDAREM
ncbi:unnamed protein product, partial [Closterium sp. NIES-54]